MDEPELNFRFNMEGKDLTFFVLNSVEALELFLSWNSLKLITTSLVQRYSTVTKHLVS